VHLETKQWNCPARSYPLTSYRTLYDKTALYYAHGTLYR